MATMERCIRTREGLICAWTVGMSEEEIQKFLKNNDGTYLSAEWVEW